MSEPKLQARRVAYAAAGLSFMLLFSAVNNYQKRVIGTMSGGPGLAHSISIPFIADVLLLILFAAACRRALGSDDTPSLPGPEQKRVYDPLLTLRAFACLMVLTGHALGFTFRPATLMPMLASGSPVSLIVAAPEAGVWVFFTLSGYLIGKGFWSGRYRPSRPNVQKFYRNRVLRIVPLYWFTLGLFSLLFIPAIFAPGNLSAFINMLLFNVNGNLPYMPIGALWSIATEMEFYLAAPLLFILLRGSALRSFGVPVLVAVALAIYRMIAFKTGGLQNWFDFAYAPLFGNLDLFLTGMAASALVVQKQRQLSYGLAIGSLILLLLYMVMAYLRVYAVLLPEAMASFIFTGFGPSLTAILTAAAIFCFELAPKYPPGSMVYRLGQPTAVLGTLTYAAYSWHEPILLHLKPYIGTPSSLPMFALVFAFLLLIIFTLSWVLHRLIELPFERLKTTSPSG
jgi:peptidoglycan/LPS O-acetylase OafA/YrhL